MTEHEMIDSQSDEPIVETDFQNANAIIDSISTPKDSQPTKLRVKNFKNRVFHLLKIYTTQSANINPLIQSLKQEMFFNEPEKMQELLQTILNKQNVTLENLQQLTEYYKVILLYKGDKKSSDSVAPEFVRLIKKLSSVDQELAHKTILDMLKSFAYQRKCRLNINFFFYFFRKYEHSLEIKKLFLEKLQEFIQDEKLRNAQKKQLTKILQRLDKSTRINNKVKKQQAEEHEEEDDDIKATNKKNININKVKKHEEDELEKIQQEKGEQKKFKKQISQGQQQKLQRIKDNKKKNRKNNQIQKNPSEQKNQKNSHSQQKPAHKNHPQNQQKTQKSHPKQQSAEKKGHSNSKPKFNGKPKINVNGNNKK